MHAGDKIAGATAADGAEQVEGFGEGELFADVGGDEAASTDFTAELHAAKLHQQVSPGGGKRLLHDGVAEEDSPAREQLTSKGCDVVFGRGRGVAQQAPSAGRVSRPGSASFTFAAAALGIEQGAEILESIGGGKSGGD